MLGGIGKNIPFLKRPDPKELVTKWRGTLRAEERKIDRQIRDIQFEEKKVQKSIKEAAKRSDLAACQVLAKEIVQSRRAVSRLYVNKAQMISLNNALSEQLAMAKVAGSLQKSTDVMKLVNETMRLPEMQAALMEMSKEMQKAGLIQEMTNDIMDSALGADVEEEADAEVQAVLQELAGDVFLELPDSPRISHGEVASPLRQDTAERQAEALLEEEARRFNEGLKE